MSLKKRARKRLKKVLEWQYSWLLFALLAMVLFAVANLTLKILVNKSAQIELPQETVLHLVLLVAAFAVIAYFLIIRNLSLPHDTLVLILLLIFLSASGFVLLVTSLNTGKVALVTAILSIGTVLVAILAHFVLGETLNPKQYLAILAAVVSILLLVI